MSWRRVRLFLFGSTWMLCESSSWSDCFRDSVVDSCVWYWDMISSPALIVLEAAFSWCTLLLKLLRIDEADLAYSSNYSWLSRWWFIVNSPSKPLKESGSKRSAVFSRIELLRTCFKTLSALISYSTSNMVQRWLTASFTFLTRVHNIGVSNNAFYFDGRYTDTSSEEDSESESFDFLLLKNFDRIDCFMRLIGLYWYWRWLVLIELICFCI